MASHELAKFGGHRHSGSEDIMIIGLSRDITILHDQMVI